MFGDPKFQLEITFIFKNLNSRNLKLK